MTIAHVWRFVGIYFLVGAIVGILPPQFGFPEGLGEIAVTCLVVLIYLFILLPYFTGCLMTVFILSGAAL